MSLSPVLIVSEWSFGRDRRLLADIGDLISQFAVELHFCQSDIDFNRTHIEFSGEMQIASDCLKSLCSLILPFINLQRHSGSHPRIGALDYVLFVPLQEIGPNSEPVENFSNWFADKFDVPVFLCEQSESPRHEAELANLRKGGFGGLLDLELNPDFGPTRAHPHLGVLFVGLCQFRVSILIHFSTLNFVSVKQIADAIKHHRVSGDPRMAGVRALALLQNSQEMCALRLTFMNPGAGSIDGVLEYIDDRADQLKIPIAFTELIGSIRVRDLEFTTRVFPRPQQTIDVSSHTLT